MADLKIRYLVSHSNEDGTFRYYWKPAKSLRVRGWKLVRLPSELGAAVREAQVRNAELDKWRQDGEQTVRPSSGSLKAMITAYEADRAFTKLRDNTKRGYRDMLKVLNAWMGHAPARAITAPMLNEFYKQLYWKNDKSEELNTPSKANAIVRVARLLWEWGIANGYVSSNIARPIAITTHRSDPIIWPRAAVLHLVAVADKMGRGSIGTAILLNEWLGQRQADVLQLSRTRYRNGALTIRQEKIRGSVVRLPVDLVPHLKQRLEAEFERFKDKTVIPPSIIVSEETGRAYAGDNFRHWFAEIRRVAAEGDANLCIKGIPTFAHDDDVDLEDEKIATKDLDFMHLRHTAVTRQAAAGVTEPEIAAVTGHALGTVHSILERYMVRTSAMAVNSFKKRLDAEGRDSSK